MITVSLTFSTNPFFTNENGNGNRLKCSFFLLGVALRTLDGRLSHGRQGQDHGRQRLRLRGQIHSGKMILSSILTLYKTALVNIGFCIRGFDYLRTRKPRMRENQSFSLIYAHNVGFGIRESQFTYKKS